MQDLLARNSMRLAMKLAFVGLVGLSLAGCVAL
jgi:hypothetical protein